MNSARVHQAESSACILLADPNVAPMVWAPEFAEA